MLLERGAEPDIRDWDSRTPISWAATAPGFYHDGDGVVKLRLESNADADSINESGRTPLSWAVDGHNTALAAILIEKGAALNSKDKDGQTPL